MFCSPQKIYLGGADKYAETLGITGSGLREALKGANVVGVSGQRTRTAVAPLLRFDALKQYLYDVEQGYLREGSKIRLPRPLRFAVA